MEKQNNKLWITRLESLEAPLSDSNALWERLHARTAKNRKTKAAYWYAAAASVIIFSGILFIPAKKEELPVAVTTREKPQAPVVKKVIEHPVQPNENNLTSKVKTTKNKKPAAYARITIKKQVPQISSPALVITPVADSLPTNIAIVPPSPSKKKMRVVHINRIENYIEQKQTEDYFTNNSRDGIIKIKLSPSN